MPSSEEKSAARITIAGLSTDAPRQMEQLLTTTLDACAEGISIHAASGTILWANKSLCDLYGKSPSEIIDSSCQQIFHHADSQCPHERVLETGEIVQAEAPITISGRTLTLTVIPLFDDKGAASGFIRVLRDIPAEVHIREQTLTAERFATLGQVLFGIAHDVGTPLNIISGYAEFLLMRTKPDEHGFKELSAIINQTRRITAMLGEALELARAPQGRTDAIDLKTLMTGVLDLVSHSLRKADVKAALTCGMSPPLVYGETSQLRQAFFNILVNAGQQLGRAGRLEVVIDEAIDRPGFLKLTFWGTDAGGIGHDFSRSLPALFGRSGEAATGGLGLSLALKILSDTGAEIGSSVDEKRGVSFVVYLPVNSERPEN